MTPSLLPKTCNRLAGVAVPIGWANRAMQAIPASLIALIGRFSLAAVFWKAGQTKIENFSLDLIDGRFDLGWPRLAESTLYLFQEEYALPLLSSEVAAYLATFAEHALPVMLLLGLGTRFAALGLLTMTLVIQVFVYPDAYVVHGTWAAIALMLMARGGGYLSLDYVVERLFHRSTPAVRPYAGVR